MLKINSKYDWGNKDKFLDDLKKSSSMSDFLVNNKMTSSSGNFRTFKKWCVYHKIEINSFLKRKIQTRDIVIKEKKDITPEDLLIKSHHVGVKEVKKLLKKENLIKYCCSGCGNHGAWNSKPLKLQLEHKNGDNTDNRLENLEYLCPNCHSQTPTYGSKNTHNKLFAIRIQDLLEIKNIQEESITYLMKKWNLSYSSVKDWIHKYSKKINASGVNILVNKNMHENNPQYIDAIEELKKTNCTLDDISNISKKFNVQSQALRKLLKTKNETLFNTLPKSVSTENIDEANEVRKKRLNYIKNIEIKNLNIKEMLNLFEGNHAYMLVWLNKNCIKIYEEVMKMQPKKCPKCTSENITKKGTIQNNGILLQKHECKDCGRTFRCIKDEKATIT